MSHGTGSAAYRLVRGTATAAALALLLSGTASCSSSADSQRVAAPHPSSPTADAGQQSAGGLSPQFFGMHAPDAAAHYPDAGQGSIDFTTNAVYWPQLETSPGHFEWAHLDGLLASADDAQDRAVLVLGLTPDFHGTLRHGVDVRTAMPDLGAWRRYVTAVVDRYANRLDYQIWPEANIVSNWSGTPHQLATLVAEASKIIRQRAPRATVIGPAMATRLPGQRAFLRRFYKTRVGGRPVSQDIDAVAVDAYPALHGTPETSLRLLQRDARALRRLRVTAPIWNTEINYGVVGGGTPDHLTVSAQTQADWVARTLILDASADIGRVYWLGWGQFETMSVQMLTAGGSPTLAGQAYRTVASWLVGRTVRSCMLDLATRVYDCVVTRGKVSSHIYWALKGTPVVEVPAGSQIERTLDGDQRPLPAGRTVRLTQSPVLVTS